MRKSFLFTIILFLCIAIAPNIPAQTKYGENILSITPIAASETSAIGFGIHYERMIEERHKLSVVLPVTLIMVNKNDFSIADNQYTNTYFYPGVRFYPKNNNRAFSYSIGACAVLGFGKFKGIFYDYATSRNYERTYNSRGGVMINHGLSFQPTQSLYIGMEGGLGLQLYYGGNNNYEPDEYPLVKFQIHIGYRF